MKLVEFEKSPIEVQGFRGMKIIVEEIYEIDASTSKWTTLDLGQGWSESDLNLHINFEYCENINHEHIDLESQEINVDKNNFNNDFKRFFQKNKIMFT